MKQHATRAFAALLASGSFSLAYSQAPPSMPADAPGAKATSNANVPAVPYVTEPIASPVKTQGDGADKEAALVQALNAEASLKGSKITVAVENDGVTLTGVTVTKAQRAKAAEIAGAQFSQDKVVNAILPEEA